MIKRIMAAAGLALIVPPAVAAAAAEKPSIADAVAAVVDAEEELSPSAETLRMADWISASGDNQSLPYAIIDKVSASLFLFDGEGQPLGTAPVLIGIALGDDATPGIGTKKLSEIGPAEKTTPAGRFLAKFGLAAGRQKVLWVDYATSVAIHTIPPDAAKAEKRRDRMLSPTPDDNRITFGCINVPKLFYRTSLRPAFQKEGGYVYILPDSKPLEAVFPRFRAHQAMSGGRAR